MYKTREKYYIIIMSFKNDKEYHAALENYVRLRNDKSTPVLTLEQMYDSFVEEEYSRMQDAAIYSWLDNMIADEVFSNIFLNEQDLRLRAITFLDEKMIPHAEQVVNGEKSEE